MEPSPTRLFLAAVPDAASRRGLEHLQTLLRAAWPGAPGVRWTLPADLHLTLRYLGAASPGQRAGIAALAARTMVGPRRFELQPGVLAAWPARRPRLLVLEYPGPPELAHLVAELEAGARSLGFAGESRPWRPHVTLARGSVPDSTPEPPAPPRFVTHALGLFGNASPGAQMRYRLIQSWPLPAA